MSKEEVKAEFGIKMLASLAAVGIFLAACGNPAAASTTFYQGLGVVMIPGQTPIVRWFESQEDCKTSYENLLQKNGMTGASYYKEDNQSYIFTEVPAVCLSATPVINQKV